MRSLCVILLTSAMPVAGPLYAQDSGARGHPADRNPACMDRRTDTSVGGCITREDGTSRERPPVALPPESDTTRQNPPAAEATPRGELPIAAGESR